MNAIVLIIYWVINIYQALVVDFRDIIVNKIKRAKTNDQGMNKTGLGDVQNSGGGCGRVNL